MNKWLRFRWNFMYNINDEQTDGKYLSVCHSSVYGVVFLFIDRKCRGRRLIEVCHVQVFDNAIGDTYYGCFND